MAGPFLNLEMDAIGISAKILDISSSQIKVLDKYHLEYEDLPKTETGETRFQGSMNAIFANMDVASCSSAVVFISSLDVCFRNIHLPFAGEKKINQILSFELAPLMPVPDTAYVSDFFTQEFQFVQDQHPILTASIEESMIGQLVSCLKQFKIFPCVITPLGYASAVCFLEQKKEGSDFVFIHIARCDITLTLVANRKPVMLRSFASTDSTPEIIARQTLRTILGFRQRSGSKIVFDVFVAAPESLQNTPEIMAALHIIVAQQSDFEQVVPRSPLVEMVDSKKILSFISPDRKPDFLLNFCKGQFRSDSFIKKYRTGLMVTFFMGLILFATSVLGIYKDIALLEQGIALKKQTGASIYRETFPDKAGARVQAPLLMMQAQIKQALKENGADNQKNAGENTPDIPAGNVLFELSNSIPAAVDIDISRMILNHGRLIISGSTDNFNSVDKIKGLIENSDLFKKVSISSAEAGKTENRISFKFIIDM